MCRSRHGGRQIIAGEAFGKKPVASTNNRRTAVAGHPSSTLKHRQGNSGLTREGWTSVAQCRKMLKPLIRHLNSWIFMDFHGFL